MIPTPSFRSHRASDSVWPAFALLLVLLAAFFLACLAIGQVPPAELPVATPAASEFANPFREPVSASAVSASPSLPPTALVITVLVPLLIAAAKQLFPNLPSSVLPVLAPVLGAALEFGLSRFGLNGGGTVAGAVAGGAGVGLREIVDQQRRSQLPASVALFALGLLLFTPGCLGRAPDGRIVGVTQSVIGIDVGQSSADSVPHMRVGYVRSQFHIVPTGSNIYAPAVLSSMSLDNTFSHQVIDEDFATGGATRDLSPNSPAATGAKARAERNSEGAKARSTR